MYKRATLVSLLFNVVFIVEFTKTTFSVCVATFASTLESCALANRPIKRTNKIVKIAFMTWVLHCKGNPT